jgi:hypothetical protein
MRYSKIAMSNLHDCKVEVTVGNSGVVWSAAKGTYKGTIIQHDGTNLDLTLNDVLYVPDLWLNLLSLTKAIQNPNIKLGNINNGFITLENNYKKIIFDKVFTNGSGRLLGIDINPVTEDVVCLAGTHDFYSNLHAKLGHPNHSVVQATAERLGIKLNESKILPCAYCAIGKSRKTNIPKTKDNKATMEGEPIALDISYVNHPSFGGAKYWLLIQDEFANYLWSFFLKAKSDLPNVVTY